MPAQEKEEEEEEEAQTHPVLRLRGGTGEYPDESEESELSSIDDDDILES